MTPRTATARIGLSSASLLSVAVFAGAIGLFSLEWLSDLPWGGVSTVGAARVLRGDLPYRDFWTMYAPGQFYLLALVFRLFGSHLLVERVAASIVSGLAAVAIYELGFSTTGRRLAGLVSAAVFVVAMANTGYFKNLGSFPPSILFVYIALNLVVRYYRNPTPGRLFVAGLATGAVATFKHDVGAYTALATAGGLVVYRLISLPRAGLTRRLAAELATYGLGAIAVVLPWLIYFEAKAGPAMWQDLVVFPLTDFRFARPEGYPSLLPIDLVVASRFQTAVNVMYYLNFALPSVVFAASLIGLAGAVRARQTLAAAIGTTFAIAFLLHYAAAHVQINTHIITMSVYSALLGGLGLAWLEHRASARRQQWLRWLSLALAGGWCLTLVAKPAYLGLQSREWATAELRLAPVSGFHVTPEDARIWEELAAFVDEHVPPDKKLYVGLNRHDVVVINDVLAYFILDRAVATRYQELHPGIVDTARVQQEMIQELQTEAPPVIVLKRIFPDTTLERVKRDFQKNLPQVGATDLDSYIRSNYTAGPTFGPWTVWQRNSPAAALPAGRINHTCCSEARRGAETPVAGD